MPSMTIEEWTILFVVTSILFGIYCITKSIFRAIILLTQDKSEKDESIFQEPFLIKKLNSHGNMFLLVSIIPIVCLLFVNDIRYEKRPCVSSIQSPKRFEHYGGRGITVCKRWDDFKSFLEDMGERPSLAYKIERIDNDGNYEPSNCKWATHKEQMNNTRRNHILEWQGKRMNVGQWAEELGINYVTLATRVQRGWPMEKIMTQPIQVRNK